MSWPSLRPCSWTSSSAGTWPGPAHKYKLWKEYIGSSSGECVRYRYHGGILRTHAKHTVFLGVGRGGVESKNVQVLNLLCYFYDLAHVNLHWSRGEQYYFQKGGIFFYSENLYSRFFKMKNRYRYRYFIFSRFTLLFFSWHLICLFVSHTKCSVSLWISVLCKI